VAKTRVAFLVTEEGATEETARRFLIQLQTYPLVVIGVTTDGSSIYPGPLAEVFPGARHQVCEFHTLKEMNLLALRAVARVRKQLRAQLLPRQRGRPAKGRTPQARRQARREKAARDRITALWENRHLFVQRKLTAREQAKLKRITRGQPQLRALREFVDAFYKLFDRRCSTATALGKLNRLRRRHFFAHFPALHSLVRKLQSPNLEKALEFLDDDLLEPTSNAAERANRRHRKMQKTVYRFRCRRMIVARITLDMLWQCQRQSRAAPKRALHLPSMEGRAVA
jgi:hypothetical protein